MGIGSRVGRQVLDGIKLGPSVSGAVAELAGRKGRGRDQRGQLQQEVPRASRADGERGNVEKRDT